MKFLLFFSCVLLGLPAMAQRNIAGNIYDYSTVNFQRINYRVSYSDIYVKFQANTTDAEIGTILRGAGFKVADGDYTLDAAKNPQGFSKVSLSLTEQNLDVTKLKAILTNLETSPKVIVANPYIVWNGAKTEKGQLGISETFYVKLKPTTTIEEFRALVAVTNTSIKSQYPYNALTYILVADKNARGNSLEMANQFYESTKFEYAAVDFELKPTIGDYKATPLPMTHNELKSIKDVKDVMGVQATVNDALWPWQYSHRVTAAGIPGGAYPVNEARTPPPFFPGLPAPRPSDQPWNMDASMLVDQAWDIATTAGAGIKVAIIDNGVDRGHPDLVANINALGFDPSSATNLGDRNGTSGRGDHGTTCAGVVAAVANNGIGVAGVAYKSSIVPVQIFNTDNAGTAQAIDWSWQVAQVDVMSNSWGFPNQPANFSVALIADAFVRAITLGRGGKGCVVLCSAGNGGGDFASFPGSIPGVIGVIASNAGSTKAGFSQFGQFSDLAAPGNQIITTDRRDAGAFNGGQGFTAGEYCIIDGTSFSCPNAAGVAALILGVDANLTQAQVRQYLEGTCKKVPAGAPYTCTSDNTNGSWGAQLGYGIVNAYEAVLQASRRDNFCSTVTFTQANGAFEDGSFARNYENNKDCRFIIAPANASAITAIFTKFTFGAGDRLEVYTNSAATGTPIAIFSATNQPTALGVTSNTGVLALRMVTDGTATADGFAVCYTANIPAGNFIATPTTACVGVPVVFTPQPAAGSTIIEYRWNFGAGATPATATTTTATPVSVAYSTTGLKTINLTLVGPGGSVDVLKTNFVNVPSPMSVPFTATLETGLPNNWSVTGGGANTWRVVVLNNPAQRLGGFAESRAAAMIEWWNVPVGQEDILQVAPFNLTGVTTPFLVFDVAHKSSGSDILIAEVSTDCGVTWTEVYGKQSLGTLSNLDLATTTVPGEYYPTTAQDWRREAVPLPASAANRSNVLVRFVAISDFGNNLFLDNINITATPPPGRVSRATAAPVVVDVPPTASFTAVAVSGTQINLSWSDNSTNETGFLLQRAISGTATYTNIASLAPNTTTFADNTLANGTIYTYRLFAVNGSEVSSAAAGTVPAVPTAVAGVENFTLIARTTTQAGAATALGGFPQPFATCGAYPAGWTNNIIAGNAAFDTWRIDNVPTITNFAPVAISLNPNITGCYAYFSSDRFSLLGGAEDVAFESPTINAAGLTTVRLSFNAVINTRFGGGFFVEVFNPTTSAWEAVYTAPPNATPTVSLNFDEDISAKIANTTTGRVRFRYTGNNSMAAAIDNVNVFSVIPGPSNLIAALTAPAQVTLSWRDNTTGETGFDIERSVTSATAGFAVIGTSAALAATGATGTFVDGTVVAGTSYWYRVRARISLTSTTDPTNVAAVQTVVSPTNLVIGVSPSSFTTLVSTWVDNATNETGYVLERSLDANIGYAVIASLPANTITYNDQGLSENTRYFYRVRAVIGVNGSDNSNVADGVTGVTMPSALSALALSHNSIRINWTDNSNNESGYRIESSTIGSSTGFTFVANVAANVVEYTHSALNADTRVFYRISPVGLNGNLATYTTETNAVTFPAAPTNLVGTNISSSAIRLTWTDNSSTKLGYEIYRSTSISGNYNLIERLPIVLLPSLFPPAAPNTKEFIDATAMANVTYFYRVRAYRNAGEFSLFSNTTNAAAVLPAPVLSVSFVSTDRIGLEWVDNTSDESGFVVERTTRTENINGVLTPLAFDVVANVGPGVTTFTNTGLSRGTLYYYRVRAVKGSLSSAFSNIVNGTTRIGAPSNVGLNLKGTAGNGLVRLNWTAVADPDVVFEVYYFSENKINTLAATVTTTNAVITGLENGVDHWFRIKAVSKASGLKSDYSNTVELRPSIVLGTDDNLTSQGFEIYPNPTSSEFTLKLSQTTKPVSVTVVSVTGQVVHAQKFNEFGGSETINLGAISSGVYVVRVETENGSYQKRLQVVK